VRTVEIASGATAVQIGRPPIGSRDLEHIGSAQDNADLEIFKVAARQRLVAGQGELDLGLERSEPAKRGAAGGPLPVMSSRMGHLCGGLAHAYVGVASWLPVRQPVRPAGSARQLSCMS
jgi:hypothetical protein